ncbi:MAG TPA: FAD:protein FMN transferase [Pirellulaceae bacterium]
MGHSAWFILIICLAPAHAIADEAQRLRGTCMGTTYALTIADRSEKTSLTDLEAEIGDELERIEQIFSLYRPRSELSRFNAAPSGEWIEVSSDLLAVTKQAIDLARETGGAFDPTIGPLIRLWRLRQVSNDWVPPHAAAIAEARKRVGFRRLEVRDEPRAIRKLTAGMELDLNALVEGWAIDRVFDLLQRRAIKNALVELGGEFRAIGHNPDGRLWKIGIENPLELNSFYAAVVLTDAAISTSGNYRQTIEFHGRRYGHILDARTGTPVEHDLLSVSVIAHDAQTADAWATALMALGPTEGFALAQKKGLAASFSLRVGQRLHSRLTPAASNRFALTNK